MLFFPNGCINECKRPINNHYAIIWSNRKARWVNPCLSFGWLSLSGLVGKNVAKCAQFIGETKTARAQRKAWYFPGICTITGYIGLLVAINGGYQACCVQFSHVRRPVYTSRVVAAISSGLDLPNVCFRDKRTNNLAIVRAVYKLLRFH